MLHTTPKRPSIPLHIWVARKSRTGSSRIAVVARRTFYTDLYENEGHLFDLHRDEGRPSVSASPIGTSSRSHAQQHSRFSTSRETSYQVERQMQKVSRNPIAPRPKTKTEMPKWSTG